MQRRGRRCSTASSRARAAREGVQFIPFDPRRDYRDYIDGKQRSDGVRSFLASRGIALPEGSPGDPADADTVSSLGDRKNELLLAMIHSRGVQAYEGSVRFVRAVREAGVRRAVVSASANCRQVLEAAGSRISSRRSSTGLSPSTSICAASLLPTCSWPEPRPLDIAPAAAAVFEDALAGVAAGRAGAFGLVVGVDRVGQADALRAHGADIVVTDLAELLSPA